MIYGYSNEPRTHGDADAGATRRGSGRQPVSVGRAVGALALTLIGLFLGLMIVQEAFKPGDMTAAKLLNNLAVGEVFALVIALSGVLLAFGPRSPRRWLELAKLSALLALLVGISTDLADRTSPFHDIQPLLPSGMFALLTAAFLASWLVARFILTPRIRATSGPWRMATGIALGALGGFFALVAWFSIFIGGGPQDRPADYFPYYHWQAATDLLCALLLLCLVFLIIRRSRTVLGWLALVVVAAAAVPGAYIGTFALAPAGYTKSYADFIPADARSLVLRFALALAVAAAACAAEFSGRFARREPNA